MAKRVYGINVIRAYELSWLDAHGKPQLGVVEITQNYFEFALNTWLLKELLDSLNNKRYVDVAALTKDFTDTIVERKQVLSASNIKIIPQKDFASIVFFEKLNNLKTKVISTYGLRFICESTNQPFIGTVNIIADKNCTMNHDAIINDLNLLRNNQYTPNSFVEKLFTQLQGYLSDDFVISVHLNRRGGISHQLLRCSSEQDLTTFLCRSILE